MPVHELQAQLDALRRELDTHQPSSAEERAELAELMQQIEARVQLENATHADSLVDNVNYAAERFEVKHPGLAGALRNIIQTLGNIGV